MMRIGIINYYYSNRSKKRRRNIESVGTVAFTHYYSPSAQPKTTTNNALNPINVQDIHPEHTHSHTHFHH